VDNAQEIVLLLGWRNLAQAQSFVHSVSWQRVRQEMGVVGLPEVRFLAPIG
jgi:hypothetical protein